MAYELVYTSAPEGLNRGSSGFCVVACTRGLGPRLVVTLEGLSAYKPLYPHYAPNAWDNPVSRSHYIYEANGERQHILSRICFNGVDHTGRSNKLASHLVLSEREAAAAQGGPSSLLLREELFKDAAWPIKAEYFAKQKEIPPTTVQVRKCTLWESVMGDAGWAGFLAQTYLDTPNKNVYLAYDPEQNKDILPLLHEAMALLPDDLRWEVTFNTYFVNLPAGMSCTWRCCPVDSDALRASRRSPMNMVIDITKPQVLEQEGELISSARTGTSAKLQQSRSKFSAAQPEEISLTDAEQTNETVYLGAPQVEFQRETRPRFVPDGPGENEKMSSSPPAWTRLFLTVFVILALLAATIGGVFYFVSAEKEKQVRMEEYKTLKSDYDDAVRQVEELNQTPSTVKTEEEINDAGRKIANCEQRLDAVMETARQLKPYQKYFEEPEGNGKNPEQCEIKKDLDEIAKDCERMKTRLQNTKAALEKKRKEILRRQEAEKKAAAERSKTSSSSRPDPRKTKTRQAKQTASKKPKKDPGKVQKLPADDPCYLWEKSKPFHDLEQDQHIDVRLGVRDPGKIAIVLPPSREKIKVGGTFTCEPDEHDHAAEIETKFDPATGVLSFTLKNTCPPKPEVEVLIQIEGKEIPLYFKLGISKIQPLKHPGDVKIEIDKTVKVSIADQAMLIPDFSRIYGANHSLCKHELFALYLNCPGFKKLKLEKQGDAYVAEDSDSKLSELRSRLGALKDIEKKFREYPMRFAKMVPDKLKNERKEYGKLSRGKEDKKNQEKSKQLVEKIVTKLKTEIPLKDLGYTPYTGTWEEEKADTEQKLAARKREIEKAIRNSTVVLVYDKQEYKQFDLKDIL